MSIQVFYAAVAATWEMKPDGVGFQCGTSDNFLMYGILELIITLNIDGFWMHNKLNYRNVWVQRGKKTGPKIPDR